jgi:NADH-quinone oxidoreductase subunit J
MLVLFVIAADVAVIATVMAVATRVILHALLYLAVSLIAVAMVFYTLGAPFVAALEVIIYAGAIVVLFLFAVMLLAPQLGGLGAGGVRPRAWIAPVLLGAVLLGELVYVLASGQGVAASGGPVGPRAVGVALFGPYVLAVELASMLLLVALIGVRHLAAHRIGPAQAEVAEALPLRAGELESVPALGGGIAAGADVQHDGQAP